MCKIKGCEAKPVAKGLCAKHYMRKRRQGSVRKMGKPGRPQSPLLGYLRDHKLYGRSTPRTLARTAHQYRFRYAGLSDQEIVDAHKAAMRNVAQDIERLFERLFAENETKQAARKNKR